MRLFLKVVFIGTGLLLIAVAIAAIAAARQADKLARYQAERTLRHVFKSDATVEAAEVSILGQSLALRNVAVPNPPGFDPGTAMEFGEVDVAFQGATILSKTPVVSELIVSNVLLNMQYDTEEGVNILALLREAQRTSLERRSQLPVGARREFLIKTLRCEGAKVKFSTTAVPTPDMGLDVASFTLTDISKDRPVTPAQLSAIFVKSLLVEAATFKGLLRPVAELLRDELDKLLE